MWLKRTDNSYTHAESGSSFTISEISGNWRIFLNGTGAPAASGFSSQEDAQDALDAFMAEQGYEQIPNGS